MKTNFALFFFMSLLLFSHGQVNPNRESLLLYMDKLRDIEMGKINETEAKNITSLTYECDRRRYDFSVYFRMVYFRMCGNDSKSYYRFCADLGFFFKNNSGIKAKIIKNGMDYRVFGFSQSNNELWYANQACQTIHSFYMEKKILNSETSFALFPTQPNFTEWFIHSIPFVDPISCGFTENEYNIKKPKPSASDCLSPNYKWALRATFIIDGIIIITIMISNVIVLAVSWKTKMTKNAHGKLRVSLAIADLLTILVVSGSINTTHAVYFGYHKFTENGESISILDYHAQSYIDGIGMVTVTTLAASVFVLVAISLDRFFALFRPLTYKFRNQRFKHLCYLFIACIWMISIGVALLPLFLSNTSYAVTALGVIIAPKLYLVYSICLGGSLVAVWILNLWMCMASQCARSSLRDKSMFSVRMTTFPSSSRLSKTSSELISAGSDAMNQSPISSCGNSQISLATNKTKNSTEGNLVSTVRLVVVGFSVAITPCLAVMAVGLSDTLEPSSENFKFKNKTLWNTFAYISSRLLFANSFFNCFIYSYKSSKFRAAAKNILLFRRRNASTRKKNEVVAETQSKQSRKRASSIKSIQETI